jgi:hypothetical protein
MGTSITLPGGKAFDGTDYIYVYGDKDPAANGVELQSALTKAGLDTYTNGRRQTVVIGPGDYSPGELGNSFNYDVNRVSLTSLNGDTDVNMDHAGFNRFIGNDSNSQGNILDLTPGINTQIYKASLALGSNNSLAFNRRCVSDYITLSDDSAILLNEGNNGGSGHRFVKVSNTNYTIGPDLNNTFLNIQTDYYWVIKNPLTGLREIYVCGYWGQINQRVFYKINTTTLDYDSSFAYVLCDGGITDIAICSDGSVIVVGGFSTLNSYPSVNIGKILPNGFLETQFWNSGSGFNSYLSNVIYDTVTNTLYCGGQFNEYMGNISPYFAIINATTGAWTNSAGYPNNAVSGLKKFEGSPEIYVFGPFNAWDTNSFNGNNVVITSTGAFQGTLFVENVSPFYDPTMISATIDSSTVKTFRFTNMNQAPSVNGTPSTPYAVIELTIGQLTISYPVNNFTSSPYAQQVYYEIYSTNGSTFLSRGNFNFNGLKLIDAKTLNNVYYQETSFSLQGIKINGTVVISSNFNNNYKINNCKIFKIIDSAAYNNIFSFSNIPLKINNSEIDALVWQSRITLDKATIQSISVSQALRASSFRFYADLIILNSSVNEAYNDGTPMYIQSCIIKNSQVNNSFNNGYKGAGSNDYLDISNCFVENSLIQYSFRFTKYPIVIANNCEFRNAFSMEYVPYDTDLNVVLGSQLRFRGQLTNIIGVNYMFYDFSNLRNLDLTNKYFQDFNITFNNCISTGGSSLTFLNAPANAIRKTYFTNCHLFQEPYGYVPFYGLCVTIMNDLYSTYALSQVFNDVKFIDCTADKVSIAFVLGLILKSENTPLGVSNIYIKNCTHTAVNQVNSFGINIQKDIPSLIPALLLDSIEIVDCQVIGNSTGTAFMSSLDNIQDLILGNINFTNCHIKSKQLSSNYSFLTYIQVANVNVITPLVFNNCSGTSAGYSSNMPNAISYGFLNQVTTGTFNAINGHNLIFLNCVCDSGFIGRVYNGVSGDINMYAKNCIAHYGESFGKSIETLRGEFINCDGGLGSFGDAFNIQGDYVANHQGCTFIQCSGTSSFGLDVAGPNTIYNGGSLYHYTTISGPSPLSVNWLASAYNV